MCKILLFNEYSKGNYYGATDRSIQKTDTKEEKNKYNRQNQHPF